MQPSPYTPGEVTTHVVGRDKQLDYFDARAVPHPRAGTLIDTEKFGYMSFIVSGFAQYIFEVEAE